MLCVSNSLEARVTPFRAHGAPRSWRPRQGHAGEAGLASGSPWSDVGATDRCRSAVSRLAQPSEQHTLWMPHGEGSSTRHGGALADPTTSRRATLTSRPRAGAPTWRPASAAPTGPPPPTACAPSRTASSRCRGPAGSRSSAGGSCRCNPRRAARRTGTARLGGTWAPPWLGRRARAAPDHSDADLALVRVGPVPALTSLVLHDPASLRPARLM